MIQNEEKLQQKNRFGTVNSKTTGMLNAVS